MDSLPATLAASVVTALMPYLPVIATKAAERVGENLPAAIVKLWSNIKNRFNGRETAKEILDELLRSPDDPDAQAAFRLQLRRLAEASPEFQTELRAFLDAQSNTPAIISTQSGTANIAVQGSNNSVSQTIGQIAHNVTNVGYQPKQIPAELVTEFVMTMSSLRPPVGVHITGSMIDSQTHFFANQLTSLLQKAGWPATGDSLSLYGGAPKGILYIVPTSIDSTSIDRLAGFLEKLGFLNYKQLDNRATIITIAINGV